MREAKVTDEIYENRICSHIGHELVRMYPGWEWWVECKLPTGLIWVRNLTLDGDYAFAIPLTAYLNETIPKVIMQAGGEILERYNLDRGKRVVSKDEISRDFTGAAIGETDAIS